MTEHVTIKEAADRLGVSSDTIRRRLKSGELGGEKRETPQGFVWFVELPNDAPSLPEPSQGAPAADTRSEDSIEDQLAVARLQERVEGLERLVTEVKQDRDAWRDAFSSLDEKRDRELAEMREALMQAQAITMSLPARLAIAERPERREPADVTSSDSTPPQRDDLPPPATASAPITMPSPGLWQRFWRVIAGS